MLRLPLRRIVVLSLTLFCSLTLSGCEAITGPKVPVVYSDLPTRQVQAVYPAEFSKVYAAAQRVVKDELGYALSHEKMDNTTGRAAFEGKRADGSTARIAMERSRDLATTSVTAFAVETGSTTANIDKAREILQQIEHIVAPSKK